MDPAGTCSEVVSDRDPFFLRPDEESPERAADEPARFIGELALGQTPDVVFPKNVFKHHS